MNTALYTVLTGNYDNFHPIQPRFVNDIDCYLFTDDATLLPEGWTTVYIDSADPVLTQRALKITIPEELADYDTVIYIDANTQVLRPVKDYIHYHKGPISVKQHPKRNCVYQEGFAIIDAKKANSAKVKEQLADCVSMGIRPGDGMYENGVIIRTKGNDLDSFTKAWVQYQDKGTHRDQLSIAQAVYATGIKPNVIPYNIFQQCFRHVAHKPVPPPVITYIQPYSTEKNIGKAINTACEQAPDGWIVLMDYDTMFTTPNYGRQIEDILKTTDCSLLGCLTNRIRSVHQRVEGMFDEYDIREHLKKGAELEKTSWGDVEVIEQGVAGYCMVFHKATWEKIKFKENDITFDTEFYKGVRKLQGKVGLMTGIYMFHQYRLISTNPTTDIAHLK